MAKDWIDEQYGSNADAFREQYIKDLERELAGAEAREDKAYAKNVQAEIAKLTGKKAPAKETAEKRPSAGGKETR